MKSYKSLHHRSIVWNVFVFNVNHLNILQITNKNCKLQEVQLNSRDLIELICGLMAAVGSSASIERVFSTFGLVHSKVRYHLGVDKAGKLVFLRKLLNQD